MKVLILEPFYGGSHKQLIDIILNRLNPSEYELITQTAKKWHWRARSSALWFSQQIPDNSRDIYFYHYSAVAFVDKRGEKSFFSKLNVMGLGYMSENGSRLHIKKRVSALCLKLASFEAILLSLELIFISNINLMDHQKSSIVR